VANGCDDVMMAAGVSSQVGVMMGATGRSLTFSSCRTDVCDLLHIPLQYDIVCTVAAIMSLEGHWQLNL